MMPIISKQCFQARLLAEEIAEHLQKAIEFVQNNRQICIANTIIIYAWNEFDEGGWISPTRNKDGSADTSRLDAIKAKLKAK